MASIDYTLFIVKKGKQIYLRIKMISPWNISSCNQHLAPTKKQKSQSWSMRSNDVPRSTRSSLETRVSLVFALASQAASLSQRILGDLVTEASKYSFPRSFDSRTLEEAMMTVPDLETIEYKIIKRTDEYEIREVEAYYVAETIMPGKTGLDFVGSSRGFNVLAEYLFGQNTSNKKMEMTTPVITKKAESKGEKMDMTTPVITKQTGDSWTMSFVMPSKYGENLPQPKDSSVRIIKVPQKIAAAVAFSGFVTDEDVKKRESKLRNALRKDSQFQVKENAYVEISQFNPPFTLPFNRRNEIALEVERKPEK